MMDVLMRGWLMLMLTVGTVDNQEGSALGEECLEDSQCECLALLMAWVAVVCARVVVTFNSLTAASP